MDKTATEVVLRLVASGMEKEAAIGGILNTGLAKRIIRDARRLYSNNKFLSKLPDFEDFTHEFKENVLNKGLKRINAIDHRWDADSYVTNGRILRRLRGKPEQLTGYDKGVLNSSLRNRREAFERMMKDVDPNGFIQKYKQEVDPVLESYSGAGRKNRSKWKIIWK